MLERWLRVAATDGTAEARAARSTRRACAASNVDYAAWPSELWTVFYAATPPLHRGAARRRRARGRRRAPPPRPQAEGSSETVGATRMATLSRALERDSDGLAVVEELEAAYDGTRDELLRLAALA